MKVKVSIIVPVRFRADLTRVCIDSILNYTKDFELILVQEGEDEEISTLLRSCPAKYVQNKEPKGFAGAMNMGIDLADKNTDYYCFLNNDTVVVPNWLEEMLKVFKDKEIGLVAPTCGEVKSFQHINYNHGQEIDYVKNPFVLMGVCFLIKKSIMDKIGRWDELFGLGGGDDNDICIRMLEAGYKIAIARKSFIYHYCGTSFRELFNNDPKVFFESRENQHKKIEEKYNNKYSIKFDYQD